MTKTVYISSIFIIIITSNIYYHMFLLLLLFWLVFLGLDTLRSSCTTGVVFPDERQSCLSPFRDMRDSASFFHLVGSGVGASKEFHAVSTPYKCQAQCRHIKPCAAFTFSFVEGCMLFEEQIPSMKTQGRPDELLFGIVSGPIYCNRT